MKLCTAKPPTVTADACVKFWPLIVSVVPADADVGVNPMLVGVPISKAPRPFGVPRPVGPS